MHQAGLDQDPTGSDAAAVASCRLSERSRQPVDPLHFPISFRPFFSLRSIGPSNPARGSGKHCRLPAGSGTEPQTKSNWVHFSFKIWHLVATMILRIFPILYQPEKSQSKQRRPFFLSSVAVGIFLHGPNAAAPIAPTVIRHWQHASWHKIHWPASLLLHTHKFSNNNTNMGANNFIGKFNE